MKWNLEGMNFDQHHPQPYCHIDGKEWIESMSDDVFGLFLALSDGDKMSFIEGNISQLKEQDVFEKLVISLYTGTNTPVRAFGDDLWERLFDICDGKKLKESEVDQPFSPVGEIITVYRGQDVDDCLGISWTLDRDQAKWFAERNSRLYDQETAVIAFDVTKDAILFCTNGRDEMEVVVSYDFLYENEDSILVVDYIEDAKYKITQASAVVEEGDQSIEDFLQSLTCE